MALQAIVMIGDEGWFHRRRDLPRWERIGHPLDTLTIAVCLGWLVVMPSDAELAIPIYVALAIGSCLFVTKDEGVHARLCDGGEQWLHAVLFVLHPIVLAAAAIVWWSGERTILYGQLALTVAFGIYQVVYWNVVRPRVPRAPPRIDNQWYADVGARWYEASDTPIALLRAEARHRNPWLVRQITSLIGARTCRVLDVGCGGGLLANYMARCGHRVDAIDACGEALAVARANDRTGTVRYHQADAYALPFPDGSFDVACAMDLLEHVERPDQVIAELSRVLAPSGVLFFHTFNRTWLAKLIVIKGVELFVANTPPDLHVLRLFVTPDEMTAMCRHNALEPLAVHGVRPRFRWPLWRMLLTGRVGDDFEFTFTSSTQLGYLGVARRTNSIALHEPRNQLSARHSNDQRDGTHREPLVATRVYAIPRARHAPQPEGRDHGSGDRDPGRSPERDDGEAR